VTRCLIIATDGTITPTQLDTLEDFQKAVGGYIERIPFGPQCNAFVNEFGIPDGLPFNARASHLWHVLVPWCDDPLYGPVVIAGRFDEDGNNTDVPANFLGVE